MESGVPIASTSSLAVAVAVPSPRRTSLPSPPPSPGPSRPPSPSATATPRPKAKRKKKPKPLPSPSPPLSTAGTTVSRDEQPLHGDDVKICEARDRLNQPCKDVVVGGFKGKVSRRWCEIHDQEEALVRQEWTRCSTTLHNATSPPVIRHMNLPSPSTVASTTELDLLEKWELTARIEWTLADKALLCRKYYLSHFGSPPEADRDKELYWGGKAEVARVRRAKEELEIILDVLVSRSHCLILESEDALWLLHPPPALPPCTPDTPPLPPPSAPSLATHQVEPDPVSALEKHKRAELLELLSLTGSHASFIEDAAKSVERVRVVECLFRRIISRDRELLVRAYRGGHDHVLRFFEDPLLCPLSSLQRLHASLLSTSVVALKEAITDAFRAIAWEESGAGETEEGEEGLGLQLLGGWCYKVPRAARGGEMGREEWDHLYDLCGCPGCALRVCSTFAEYARLRRLTVIPHGPNPPPYLFWGDQHESDASRIFRALDLVLCAEERGPGKSEVRRIAGGFVGVKGRGVFVEREVRNWIYLKMPSTHPKATPLLASLTTYYSVLIRARSSGTHPAPLFPTPPAQALWLTRHRSAASRADLRLQSWGIDSPSPFGTTPQDALRLLDTLDTPEAEQGLPAFTGTFEVLVMDGFGREGEGSGKTYATAVPRSFEQFEAEVGQTVLGACGLGGLKAALEWGEAESYRKGDLLFDFKAKKAVANGAGGGNGKKEGPGAMVPAAGKKEGKAKKILESMRDDALAFKLSRSLFRA